MIDVLNSQHVGTSAIWRINTRILSTCRGRSHIVGRPAQLVQFQSRISMRSVLTERWAVFSSCWMSLPDWFLTSLRSHHTSSLICELHWLLKYYTVGKKLRLFIFSKLSNHVLFDIFGTLTPEWIFNKSVTKLSTSVVTYTLMKCVSQGNVIVLIRS